MGKGWKQIACGAVLTCMVLTATTARADTLVDTPYALTDWQGTMLSQYQADGKTLSVAVDYAVFAPGQYGLFGTDPSGGAAYVYAYQIHNQAESNVGVSLMTLGAAASSGIASVGVDAVLAGVLPDAFGLGASSVRWGFGWDFSDPGLEIAPGLSSMVLLFTSARQPRWDDVTLADGGVPAASGLLPSPVPEPGTLGLLALGGLWACRRLRRGVSTLRAE